jgi:hypothetical protein
MKKMLLGVAIVFLVALLGGVTVAKGQKQAALAAPTSLKLMIVPNGFKLSWKPAAEASGAVTAYEILRADLASGPFTAVAKVDKGVSEYVDTTAAPEIVYYYKVRAVAGAEASPDSNTVTGER